MTETTHRPLTAEEFNAGCGFTFRGVPLCEDESASYIYSYGHVPASEFLWVVADYDREVCGEDTCIYEASDVRHVQAVTIKSADDVDGWWIRWSDEDGKPYPASDATFPLTVINR